MNTHISVQIGDLGGFTIENQEAVLDCCKAMIETFREKYPEFAEHIRSIVTAAEHAAVKEETETNG